MRKIYPVIILIATLLMGIGYAAVNSVLLGIDGTAGASLYEGIYITDADNGIVANSAKYESDGMRFDGIDDFISVGYSSYDFNNSFTVGARVKLNAYSDDEYTIFGNPQSGGLNLFKSTDNKFEIAVYDINTSGYVNLETSFIPELNTWYTLVATYDGTDLKLYVNGMQEAYITADVNMLSITTPFMIGVNPNLNSKLGGGYFNGSISDVLLVDEALTSQQVKLNYTNDLKTILSDKTLVSYNLRSYESREEGTVIPDEMINANWVWIPRFYATTPTADTIIDVTIVEITEESHDATDLNINVNSNIVIKPDCNSIRNKNISYTFDIISNMTALSDIYAFEKNTYDILDTHLIKNNEWSAIAYFSQSKYGLCNNGNCVDLAENTSSVTGGGDYTANTEQSTTQNVYGVYDLHGGLEEFTMGNYNNNLNSLDGFSALPDSVYLNIYTNENDYLIKKLQHAMFETNSLFNNAASDFVSEDKPWIIRNGLFSYGSSSGENTEQVGSRTVLIVK